MFQFTAFASWESPPVNIEGENLTSVEDFCYLGSHISTDGGAKQDIKARLCKARGSFSRLKTIWKSSKYSLKTKVHLYQSNVKPVLLYGAECWRMTKEDMNKLDAFHNGCLRRLCKIFWPQKISNKDLYKKTKTRAISVEIKERRFRWLGHVIRMPPSRIPRTALRWTPTGKRKVGRPKITWRRTVEAELKELKKTWGQAQAIAQDRNRWRELVAALCPTWDEED